MKKILNIGIWVFLTLVFCVIWGFSMMEQGDKICGKLNISIDEREGNLFITREEIEVKLREWNMHPAGKRISNINLGAMEDRLDMIAEVKKANVYKNLDGSVYVKIVQRNPIVRIMNAGGTQFYLDEEGYQMPLSDNYTPRVPVVTGYINEPVSRYSAVEIAKNKTLAQTVKSDEIYRFVTYIRKDNFWNAQVQQINFNAWGEMELIPTLGDHIIEFGSIDNMEGKLKKLKIFYTEALNHTDWNRFDTINVKFKNQVICTKK